jgi:hypothetical protein
MKSTTYRKKIKEESRNVYLYAQRSPSDIASPSRVGETIKLYSYIPGYANNGKARYGLISGVIEERRRWVSQNSIKKEDFPGIWNAQVLSESEIELFKTLPPTCADCDFSADTANKITYHNWSTYDSVLATGVEAKGYEYYSVGNLKYKGATISGSYDFGTQRNMLLDLTAIAHHKSTVDLFFNSCECSGTVPAPTPNPIGMNMFYTSETNEAIDTQSFHFKDQYNNAAPIKTGSLNGQLAYGIEDWLSEDITSINLQDKGNSAGSLTLSGFSNLINLTINGIEAHNITIQNSPVLTNIDVQNVEQCTSFKLIDATNINQFYLQNMGSDSLSEIQYKINDTTESFTSINDTYVWSDNMPTSGWVNFLTDIRNVATNSVELYGQSLSGKQHLFGGMNPIPCALISALQVEFDSESSIATTIPCSD